MNVYTFKKMGEPNEAVTGIDTCLLCNVKRTADDLDLALAVVYAFGLDRPISALCDHHASVLRDARMSVCTVCDASLETYKRCGCGRSFTVATWEALDFVGYQVDPEGDLELRNCPCGSTLAVEKTL